MYDEIQGRFGERISAVPHFSIERITTGDTDEEQETSLVSAPVTSKLNRHMSEMYNDTAVSITEGVSQSERPATAQGVTTWGVTMIRQDFNTRMLSGGLRPTKALLDELAFPLADGVARMGDTVSGSPRLSQRLKVLSWFVEVLPNWVKQY